jgi:cyanophycinase
MSRAAIARAQPTFPAEQLPPAQGVAGTLVIVGGGGTPKDALTRFIEAAGGVDAHIGIVSTALDDVPPEKPGELTMLTRAGCKNVRILHAATVEAAADPKFIASIKECKGIWFSGGRQWRFVDSYLDTPAEKAFHEVLKAGGVIGGSSAGATIQGDYLVRGSPLGNFEMMSEGYERGHAFMRSTAIDQHFTQRNRFKDMEAVKKAFPQLLGLGIDETTAVIVTGYDMQVVGKNNVYVYDKDKPAEGEAAYTKLAAGDKYDLKTRRKVVVTP